MMSVRWSEHRNEHERQTGGQGKQDESGNSQVGLSVEKHGLALKTQNNVCRAWEYVPCRRLLHIGRSNQTPPEAFGLAAASFFPAIVLGIFWKRMNREGAIAGMVSGIVFTAGYIYYFKFYDPAANTPDNWLMGISPEGIGTFGMLLNFVVATAVSLLTKAPPKEISDMVESIRHPG